MSAGARTVTILVAFDMFVNTLLGGNADETLSTRAGRARDEGKLWGKILAGCLDFFFPSHVEKARAGDARRAAAVMKLEE